ncbi:MAG: hypothetical protein AB1646_10850 [Thermodesulfobacteriota bacterium]
MRKRKIRIAADEAVRDIRGGLDDVELMRKYGLSATKVESLFVKLVKAGVLSEAELEGRMSASQRSHVVEVDGIPEFGERKAAVKASEILKALESGMSDIALMNEYNLSVKGLNSLYAKLVAMGKIDQAELDARRGAPNLRELGPARAELNGPLQEEQWDDRSYAEPFDQDTFWARYKVWFAAGIGASVGMALLAFALIICKSGISLGDLSAWFSPSRAPVSDSQPPQPGTVVSTLQTGASSGSNGNRDECFRRCEGLYLGLEDAEKTSLTDCRRECVAQHSPQMRKIRERFYGNVE